MEYSGLVLKFAELYAPKGDIAVARAPGLVKLLGEHIECNGLPVLSVPIADDARVAFAPRDDDTVRISEFGASIADLTFHNAARIAPPTKSLVGIACGAALQALNAHFAQTTFPGMDILCDDSVLVDSGLDRSAPLTVACALAYLRVLGRELGKDLSRLEFASLLAKGHPHSGGADFAALLAGQPDAACKVDVFPLRVESVPLLEGHVIVTCNALVSTPDKSEAGPVLCRLISEMVTKKAQEEFGDEIALDRLGDLWKGHLCLTDGEVKDLCDRTFPQELTTLDEAAHVLGLTPKKIRERWLGDLVEPKGGFPLKARVRHQIGEYRRVELGRDALLADDASEFGRLLNESHESCVRDCFQGCPELDSLITTAREARATGARLSGKGWGECTVNLVPEVHLEHFLQTMDTRYFAPKRERQGTVLPDSRMLVVEPGTAADYVKL
ncbi:MAG: galactokinase family protein [FCB group bacterium]|jgi:galactokinase|nr:galactokinase family protein [FCB group bacterium]